ncbi:sporulation histidine kinase inhibitor Sda [Halobacillus salinarum]|uniref:Sporulation histidine kinase inhibitor Sda n=1 Tax=Halobacillus salinarum TaxID=2932257 RepID=A0ABY4EQ99_9BACI|nr:sporulation histidine kinase inhibitor Sda [Halobacillus salinarum]UOQ46384.1 sporulation histidine kinase inhibitor Sda [Halobacillus salinarum]
MEELSNRLLLQTHKRAVEMKLDEEFIKLIAKEIERRSALGSSITNKIK